MSELVRRASTTPVHREAQRAIRGIRSSVQVTAAIVRAKAVVGEFAVNEVVYLKSVQREIEQRNPDAADAVALIINTTISSIARDVAQFGSEL